MAHVPDAILLIGPTGSGKTPLGDRLAADGLAGRPCRHFDFGAQLRRIAAGDRPPGEMTPEDVTFIRSVLATGALLEDEHFPVAERILRTFLAERPGAPEERGMDTVPTGRQVLPARPGAGPAPEPESTAKMAVRRTGETPVPRSGGDLIVLNGLPRHVGQAKDIERILHVLAVIELACPPEVVLARIRTNAGGDRGRRDDDGDDLIRRKLATYAARTAPLLAHYRRLAVPIYRLTVAAATTAEQLRADLARRGVGVRRGPAR